MCELRIRDMVMTTNLWIQKYLMCTEVFYRYKWIEKYLIDTKVSLETIVSYGKKCISWIQKYLKIIIFKAFRLSDTLTRLS